jgi:hypothetical protein
MITQTDFAPFASLDLDRIKTKLCHVESGEGWSRARADAAEVEYRRFLYLMKAFPAEQTVPSVEVDTFWHYHILDTMKYAADCDAVFGYFLHHDPAVGLAGDSDAAERFRGAARMDTLYQAVFGARPAASGAKRNGGSAISYCGRSGDAPAQAISYCGRSGDAPALVASYCGRSGDAPAQTASYCGRSGDAPARPTYRPAAAPAVAMA